MRLNCCDILLLALTFMSLSFAASMRSSNSPPTSLTDVALLAEQKGLHCTDGRMRLPSNRIIISSSPLNSDEAAAVNIVAPRAGTVSCYLKAKDMSVNYDPAHSMVWGNVFVYGDPAVISVLTGNNPHS